MHITNDINYKTIRLLLMKSLIYNEIADSIMVILYRDSIYELQYKLLENPDTPGNSFSSINDLWEWLIANINSPGASFLVDESGEILYDSNNNAILIQ